jgi:hypothetical protein
LRDELSLGALQLSIPHRKDEKTYCALECKKALEHWCPRKNCKIGRKKNYSIYLNQIIIRGEILEHVDKFLPSWNFSLVFSKPVEKLRLIVWAIVLKFAEGNCNLNDRKLQGIQKTLKVITIARTRRNFII